MICRTCRFNTERLLVAEWHSLSACDCAQLDLAEVVSTMLTPRVTQSLPEGWQGAYTIERATKWIEKRDREGATLLVVDRSSRNPVGMMIVFEDDKEKNGRTVRLGYLLSESVWGRGFGSELVQGFVAWCSTAGVNSIVGGVERDNVPSQRVLEKNGFLRQPSADTTAELIFELQL